HAAPAPDPRRSRGPDAPGGAPRPSPVGSACGRAPRWRVARCRRPGRRTSGTRPRRTRRGAWRPWAALRAHANPWARLVSAPGAGGAASASQGLLREGAQQRIRCQLFPELVADQLQCRLGQALDEVRRGLLHLRLQVRVDPEFASLEARARHVHGSVGARRRVGRRRPVSSVSSLRGATLLRPRGSPRRRRTVDPTAWPRSPGAQGACPSDSVDTHGYILLPLTPMPAFDALLQRTASNTSFDTPGSASPRTSHVVSPLRTEQRPGCALSVAPFKNVPGPTLRRPRRGAWRRGGAPRSRGRPAPSARDDRRAPRGTASRRPPAPSPRCRARPE